MQDHHNNMPPNPSEVIEAVLSGHRERYRDLVDCYADKVYAVAWSRLGDRHLAEEVVQETFIQGYQRLNQLKDPSKFRSWIVRIARNTAINLGIRHRNELKKRRRWAFEQTSIGKETNEINEATESQDSVKSQSLSEVMSGMRSSYRECLTLFYLEGKSIEASAKSLNISPTNFKTRLHRARTALRTQLEHHIETQLKQLKPSENTRHAIMAAVLLKTPGTYGIKAFGVSLTSLPIVNWVLFGAQFLSLLQMSLLWKWFERLVMKNYKDPASHEARTFQSQSKRNLYMVLGMALAFMFLAYWAMRMNGMQYYAAFLCFIVILPTIPLITQGPVMRHSMSLLTVVAGGFLGLGTIGYFFMHWPISGQQFCFGLFIILTTYATKNIPMGRDFSLFSRLAHKHSDDDVSSESALMSAAVSNVQASEIRSFVTYLAKHFHVVSMRTANNGIWVRTTPYKANPITSILYPFWWKGASLIFMGYDGVFQATLGQNDGNKLPVFLFGNDKKKGQERINQLVTSGIRSAFIHWRQGEFDQVEKALGIGPESDTFHVSPAKAKGNRMRIRIGMGAGIFLLLLSSFMLWTEEIGTPIDLWGMKKISLQEEDIRDFLNRLANAKNNDQQAWKTYNHLFRQGHASIPEEYYSEDALSAVRNSIQDEIDKYLDQGSTLSSPKGQKVYLSYATQSLISVVPAWEFPEMNATDWIQILDEQTPDWKVVMSGKYAGTDWTGIWSDTLHKQLLFLQHRVNLKQLDFDQTKQIIAKSQYLDTTKSVERYQPNVLKDLHGLFLLEGHEPFIETWKALSILDLTGGLESIDKEACIGGLLRHYFGKGRFHIRSKKSRYRSQSRPRANLGARDTWAAFHSLRILNALDRVDDLEDWEFLLPSHTTRKVDKEENEWPYSWFEIEAWCMRQEFRDFLRTANDSKNKIE